MSYDLISDDEYDSLPEEADARFAAFERTCRRNMNALIDDREVAQGFVDTVQMQYMTTVAAAAEELEISGLFYPNSDQNVWTQCSEFLLTASGIVTRIKLRTAKGTKPYSVQLASKSRGRIEQQIQRLRDAVNSEDMPSAKRKAVLWKLDELSTELSQSRVSYAKVMRVLAVVAACTTVGADGPKAIHNILGILGLDKAAEEAEIERIGPPLKKPALPSPLARAVLSSTRDAIDDDIPF